MRNENKIRIIVGLALVFTWILYITFIYVDSVPEGMERSCWFQITGSTDTCRGISSYLGGYP